MRIKIEKSDIKYFKGLPKFDIEYGYVKNKDSGDISSDQMYAHSFTKEGCEYLKMFMLEREGLK